MSHIHSNTGVPGKRTKDGREPTLNTPGQRGAPGQGSDSDAMIDRQSRGFMRDVQKRSQGVRGKRGKRARD